MGFEKLDTTRAYNQGDISADREGNHGNNNGEKQEKRNVSAGLYQFLKN